MRYVRNDFNRWILQKNINKKELFLDYLKVLKDQKNEIDYNKILNASKNKYSYKGRSTSGSKNTMGVRMSELNFYMFGYKSTLSNEFIPTPISGELQQNKIEDNRLFLANMFMMQYPHPNSTTSQNVNLFFGRLILKLLMDERINFKLYSDELVYLIPFVTKINCSSYERLIQDILNYRKKSFNEKLHLFEVVENYEAFFAKITHEMLYYFIRICENFGVLETIIDKNHNEGKVFKFKQGTTKTYRKTSIKPRTNFSGYIKITTELQHKVKELLIKFPFDDQTYKIGENNIFSEEDLHNDMFITQSYKLLNILAPKHYIHNEIVEKLENMRLSSINSPDGKKFEESLLSVFKEFDESYKVDIISGPGNTDIFCVFMINGKLEKFNIEAKSGSSGNNVNVVRLIRHIEKTNAEYCLMIAPRFSRGTYLDINSTKVSTITTETLYQYCMRMLTKSNYRNMPYYFISNLVHENPGKRLDFLIEDLITQNIVFDT